MRAGLQYIFFIFLVILTVSISSSGNSYSHADIQTCRSIQAAPVYACILPDSPSSLFIHRSILENVNSCRIKIPENTFIDQKTPVECIALCQRILIGLILTKPAEDDHHPVNG